MLWLSACAPLADYVERAGNKVASPPPVPSVAVQHVHDGLLVADLHADTFLWRRGLVENNPDSQVDLARMVKGNLGLQVFTIATQVPLEGRCIHARNFDPAPLLAFINGWPAPTWTSPYRRARYQAEALRDAVDRSKVQPATDDKARPVRLTLIQSTSDLETWLGDRYRTGEPDARSIGVLLGAEGAHAFNDPDGPEFETLYRLGLRMVAPTHRFDNGYGGSSEGCARGPLTDKGERLIRVAIDRRMIVDLAHASHSTLEAALDLLSSARHPAVISHSGLQSYLDSLGQTKGHRANSDQELIRLAQTGGVFGVGFWSAAIGTASVDNIVGTILRAIAVLKAVEKQQPAGGGFHTVGKASEHVALGSDWDGAVEVAVDAGQLAAITEALLKHLSADDVANIMGLNTCRVIAHSFGAGSFHAAAKVCWTAAGKTPLRSAGASRH